MKYGPEVIAAIKDRIGIAEMVGRYVALRSAGGRLVGLCPFHSETKGSFQVNADKGLYHCFGCQASGDVIDFYCKMNGLDFKEAVVQLAEQAGVKLSLTADDGRAAQAARLKKACMDMHETAQGYFREMLDAPAGAVARDYLDRRGIDGPTRARFGLGFAPESWDGLKRRLAAKRHPEADMLASGLMSSHESGRIYDRFRGRVTFPIEDLGGKVIAFGARVLITGEPKYLNSPESPIYKKGAHLYGLVQARPHITKAKRALLTEGYLDVITLHRFGYENSCGVLGTALTQEQVKRLCGFCSHVDLVFDGDAAGRKAALRAAVMLLSFGASCRAALLPQGEDVDSLLQAQGTAALDACLDKAPEGLDYCLTFAREGFSPKEQLEWARGFISGLTDPGLAALYLPRMAVGLGCAEADLRQAVGGRKLGGPAVSGSGAKAKLSPARPGPARAQRDAEILEFSIRHPEYLPRLGEIGVRDLFSEARAVALFDILAADPGGDPMQRLDERQKSFYTPRSFLGPWPESEIETFYLDLADKCRKHARDQEIGRLKQALRLAGPDETERKMSILAQIHSLQGRTDE